MTGEWPALAGIGTPALSGKLPSCRAAAARARCPGRGALEERSGGLEVADACGAEVLLVLLCSSAAGRAPGAQLLLQPRLPLGAAPRSCRPRDCLPPGTPRLRVRQTFAIWALPLFLVPYR